jgi:GntR family transcriptional regulator
MDFRTDIPIYLQIGTQIKENIVNGMLREGSKLPSVREMSVAYEVTALTVQRAVACLERENIIRSKKGIGNFVCENASIILRSQMIEQEARDFITNMRYRGLTNREIQELIQKEIEAV